MSEKYCDYHDGKNPECPMCMTQIAHESSLAPAVGSVPTDTEMLDWLLCNKKPGPVCWYRDAMGDEWLLNDRAAVAKRMNAQNS